MNTNTEVLQIVNLALMINALDGHKVVINMGGSTNAVSLFIYEPDSVVPVVGRFVDLDLPEAHPHLRLIRHHMETLLANEEARAEQLGEAA